MRKLSVAVLVAISLALGACSTSGSQGAGTTVPTSVPATTNPSSSKSAGTVSQEAQVLNQQLANLQTLLGETNSDLANSHQDS